MNNEINKWNNCKLQNSYVAEKLFELYSFMTTYTWTSHMD